MPVPPLKTSTEGAYKYDESFLQTQKDNRIQLPGEPGDQFEEVQTFDQAWIWTLMGIGLLFVFIPMLLSGLRWWMFLVLALTQVLSMTLLGSFKLYTRIDDEGIHYRMKPFHLKEKTIGWKEVDQIYVRKYSPLMEYVGWGIRVGIKNTAFNIRGNQGIQVVLKNGKRILFGTQKPEEVSQQLAQYLITV